MFQSKSHVHSGDHDAVWAQTKTAEIVAESSRLPVDLRLASGKSPAVDIAGGQRLVFLRDSPLSAIKASIKRAEDITIASLLAVILMPLMLAVAAAIILDSPGPVLFRQMRRGYNGHAFSLLKFRSMFAHLADQTAAQQTYRGDTRITRVGAFLRRHSFDELPQLFNVLCGDMSLVGPRPHAFGTRTEGRLVDEACDFYGARLRVKPGITGWAQVNGCRGVLDSVKKLERCVSLDIYYLEHWSLILDLRILLRTARYLVKDNDAY
ncbi:MAG: sugar transferase [Rhodopila sp.]